MQAALLDARTPIRPSEEIREGISGNLCRCTGYVNIVKAIQQAAAELPDGGAAPVAGRRRRAELEEIATMTTRGAAGHDDPRGRGHGPLLNRGEDPRFIGGAGDYIEDVVLPGTLARHRAKSLRARHIKGIDASEALSSRAGSR